jgi:hypothetical protein
LSELRNYSKRKLYLRYSLIHQRRGRGASLLVRYGSWPNLLD